MGSKNGFGVTLKNLFLNWHQINIHSFYTNNIFNNEFKCNKKFIYAHVPNSPARRNFVPYILGLKPEWRGNYSRQWFMKALKNFKPDLIYCLFYSQECLKFANWSALTHNTPFILHVADDSFNGKFSPEIIKIFKSAACRMAICEKMAMHYNDHTGLNFESFHNGASSSFFETISKQKHYVNTSFIIRFIGSYYTFLHEEAIEDLKIAIDILNKKSIQVKVEFYGQENPMGALSKYNSDNMHFFGSFAENIKLSQYQTADLLFIPANFNTESVNHYQFSFPTKLTECLASGTPTLLYAPTEMGSSEFCNKYKLGISVNERSISELVKQIEHVFQNPDIYKVKANQDQQFIRDNFSAEIIRNKFQKTLISALRTL